MEKSGKDEVWCSWLVTIDMLFKCTSVYTPKTLSAYYLCVCGNLNSTALLTCPLENEMMCVFTPAPLVCVFYVVRS